MRPLPFSETLAHEGDPLTRHLERVAEEARSALEGMPEGTVLQATLAGLSHDLGKATGYFQQWRLREKRKTPETDHSRLSGILFWWLSQGLRLDDEKEQMRLRLNVLSAILRHHGNLEHDRLTALGCLRGALPEPGEQGTREKDTLLRQLRSLDLVGLVAWFRQQADRLALPWDASGCLDPRPEEILSAIRKPNGIRIKMAVRDPPRGPLEDMLAFLAVYGSVLAADKIDTALEGERIERRHLPPDLVESYRKKTFDRAGPPGSLAALRREVAAQVLESLSRHTDRHHFTLTAPTGSGKTLAVLDGALHLRQSIAEQEGIVPRIIYCLPFTSVIDQNHEVFLEVLGAGGVSTAQDVLLKHHHLTLTRYRTTGTDPATPEREYEPDGAGQLLAETWQSEIVVTTFHQLLHTLLSGLNRNLKRAGQWNHAIVILDEVQAVPLEYWQGIGRLFRAAAGVLQTRFILMTATQPLIFASEAEALELLPDHEARFQSLSRVTVRCRHHAPVELADLARLLEEACERDPVATLVIVNRRKTVKQLYRKLKRPLERRGIPLLALSTDLTPLDRKARIADIRRSLERRKPILVVSTQLVEAGVDISFPVVHRDLAPLDGIIQSCGRCNRHGEAEGGVLNLWRLVDTESNRPGEELWQRVYDRNLIEVTLETLGNEEEIPERGFLLLSRRYFEACRERQGQMEIDQFLAQGSFAELNARFKLIDADYPTITVFVDQDHTDQELWERFDALKEIENPLERKKEFLGFKFRFLERVIQVAARQNCEEHIVRIKAGKGVYEKETGFIALPEDEERSCIMI